MRYKQKREELGGSKHKCLDSYVLKEMVNIAYYISKTSEQGDGKNSKYQTGESKKSLKKQTKKTNTHTPKFIIFSYVFSYMLVLLKTWFPPWKRHI